MTVGALGMVTLVVRDYDAAIDFFVGKLGFTLVQDVPQGAGKRWVEVAGAGGMRLLLARAVNAEQERAIGNQTGGRVGFFLYTDDFDAAHARMIANGVRFMEEPRHEPYGTVAVFEDLAGNRWDLLQMAESGQ